MNNRTQIEFMQTLYGSVTLFYNHKRFDVSDEGIDILLKISKGFQNRIAMGDTIFYLTDKQLKKLESILS